jgi:hypothetical protein
MRILPLLKRNLLAELIVAAICLFLPFVFMKIGPGGYAYYGPTVPDIYIFGGYIFGKDVSWPGINFAYKFQLSAILFYCIISIIGYKRYQKINFVVSAQLFKSFMLLLFPLWMWIYTSGVRSNSDGADLTIYPHLGWVFYFVLLYLQVRIYVNLIKSKKSHGI